ncbi:hypothetical protein SDC9_139827 [bioreactor metagenome]|uniref:Uncharacterized protein n=1 Tax=bioreactor metagenome TaxID=1076179 RepID=A0A645DWI8_9ZZZZ
MIAQSVPALDQALDTVLLKGRKLHRVPAEAVAHHAQGFVGPDAPVVLGRGHSSGGLGGEDRRAGEGPAESRQILC